MSIKTKVFNLFILVKGISFRTNLYIIKKKGVKKIAYIEKRIYSGNFLEIEKFKGRKTKNGFKRNKKTKISREEQKNLNDKNAKKNLNRLICANFNKSDLFVTLTFSDKKDITEVQAKKEMKNYLRRIKNFRKKNNLEELKYIYVQETDKKNGIHFHIIMNNMKLDDIKNIWGNKSRVHISTLLFDNETGIIGLAKYLLKQKLHSKPKKEDVKEEIEENENEDIEDEFKDDRIKNQHMWSQSRNIEKPKIKSKITKNLNLKKQPVVQGYKMITFENVANDYLGVLQYIRYIKIE